jgi:hypothetical protein
MDRKTIMIIAFATAIAPVACSQMRTPNDSASNSTSNERTARRDLSNGDCAGLVGPSFQRCQQNLRGSSTMTNAGADSTSGGPDQGGGR